MNVGIYCRRRQLNTCSATVSEATRAYALEFGCNATMKSFDSHEKLNLKNVHVIVSVRTSRRSCTNNNNNGNSGHLERLNGMGLKRLHIL